MNSIVVAAITFACCLCGAVAGIWLRQGPDDATAAGVGQRARAAFLLAAGVSALLFGLVGATRSSFDETQRNVKSIAAGLLEFDRALGEYGAAAQPLQTRLHSAAQQQIDALLRPGRAQHESAGAMASIDVVVDGIRHLPADDERRRALRARAIGAAEEVSSRRWAQLEDAENSLSPLLTWAVIVWLAGTFASFALYRRTPKAALAAPALGALAAAGAMFLMFEFAVPFSGTFQVSLEPLREAIAILRARST